MVIAPLSAFCSVPIEFCLPQVAPVTYLRLSSHPNYTRLQGRTLSAFPLGMSLTFIVQFYNSIGEKFHTHNTQLLSGFKQVWKAKGMVLTLWQKSCRLAWYMGVLVNSSHVTCTWNLIFLLLR